MASRKNQPWTPDEVQKVIDLKALRVSTADIADRLGRPIGGVYVQLARYKRTGEIPRYTAGEWVLRMERIEVLYLKGVLVDEIAKIYSIEPRQVRGILARRGLDEETRAMETADADVR